MIDPGKDAGMYCAGVPGLQADIEDFVVLDHELVAPETEAFVRCVMYLVVCRPVSDAPH